MKISSTVRFSLLAVACCSWTQLAGCGASDEGVTTYYEGAMAVTTVDEAKLHTELYKYDGALLAVMDISPSDATWQSETGVRRLKVGSKAELEAKNVDEGSTLVTELPDGPAVANDFLFELHGIAPGLESASATGEETDYASCQTYVWDNMVCTLCTVGECDQCRIFYCCGSMGCYIQQDCYGQCV